MNNEDARSSNYSLEEVSSLLGLDRTSLASGQSYSCNENVSPEALDFSPEALAVLMDVKDALENNTSLLDVLERAMVVRDALAEKVSENEQEEMLQNEKELSELRAKQRRRPNSFFSQISAGAESIVLFFTR